jgi:hypothetical protein
MKSRATFFALLLAAAPAAASNYLGTLKAPQSSFTPLGLYSMSEGTFGAAALAGAEPGFRLKLGYKYSPYLAVQGEYVGFGPGVNEPFANPARLDSAFRGNGFGVDTIATLPLWRFSLYGRLGAYRGDARGGFEARSMSLLPDQFTRGTRWRYGLGLRYDFTRSLGIRAELERHSPLGASLGTEVDSADQLSVGLSWRF